MNKLVLVFFLFFGVLQNGFSQKSLNDYSYVVVPEQFEFQDEKDKYQLNSLTKFLFNKYGFHAFYNREVPSNVSRCDGLWLEAEGSPGFIMTKVQFILLDCNGNEVYRTKFGKSKDKDYKKAYTQSIREAFNEIKVMNIKQNEIKNVESVKKTEQVAAVAVVKPIVENNTKEEKISSINKEYTNNLPQSKYTSYSNNGKTYLLRKTSLGYTFYQESLNDDDELTLIGKIIVEGTAIYFEKENKDRVNAKFDEAINLIIGEGVNKIAYKNEN